MRIRIIEHKQVRARRLHPDPRNYRVHLLDQRAAMRKMLDKIGYVDGVIAREDPDNDGHYFLIDGHMRVEQALPGDMIPTTVVDLTEEEAGRAMLLLDPISELAGVDEDVFARLNSEVEKGLEESMRKLAEGQAKDELATVPVVIDMPTEEFEASLKLSDLSNERIMSEEQVEAEFAADKDRVKQDFRDRAQVIFCPGCGHEYQRVVPNA